MTAPRHPGVHAELDALIRLAGAMARETGMPDLSRLKGTANLPVAVSQGLSEQENQAREQCREWAVQIREIADRLRLLTAVQSSHSSPTPDADRDGWAKGSPAPETTRRPCEASMA